MKTIKQEESDPTTYKTRLLLLRESTVKFDPTSVDRFIRDAKATHQERLNPDIDVEAPYYIGFDQEPITYEVIDDVEYVITKYRLRIDIPIQQEYAVMSDKHKLFHIYRLEREMEEKEIYWQEYSQEWFKLKRNLISKLSKLTSLGYKLNQHHSLPEWKTALEDAEQLLRDKN